MAARPVKCDDCEKKDCPQKIVGAVCSINTELAPLVQGANTRDPVLLSRFIVSVVESEHERYQKAKKVERLGQTSIRKVVSKLGDIVEVEVENGIDGKVSDLAMNLIKSGKLLNDILNPPKAVPFNQTNIQNNFGALAADEIRSMDGKDREEVLRFIDKQLDAKRAN